VVPAAELAAIVFVQFQKRAPLLVAEMHPVEAARLLLVDSPDAARFGADGVPLIAALCASHRCVRLVYGESAPTLAAIEAILSEPRRSDSPPVVPLPPMFARGRHTAMHSTLDEHSVLGRSDGVSGVTVDGRCLLHLRSNGKVIELAEAAASWLQLFDGLTPMVDIIKEVAEANEVPVAHVASMALQTTQDLIQLGVVEMVEMVGTVKVAE